MNWIPIFISLGAVLGALSRYYVSLFWIEKHGAHFPYGTLMANLTGAFLIGLVSTLIAQSLMPLSIQKFLVVGFLGAYTTFSSYILDSAQLFRSGRSLTGWFYWWGSPLLGFICVELGIWMSQRLG